MWQEVVTRTLCRLTRREEREEREAVERGEGERVRAIRRRAEKIRQAI
jgi:hypothetical protein